MDTDLIMISSLKLFLCITVNRGLKTAIEANLYQKIVSKNFLTLIITVFSKLASIEKLYPKFYTIF
jgi:hypothetical protein